MIRASRAHELPHGLRKGAALTVVFLLAVALRLLPWPMVFTPDGMVVAGGADEFYHLRRIELAVEHFPEVSRFDGYVAYPEGAQVVWPPAWDFALAAATRVLVGAGDREGMERVAAWAPPVVAGLTAVIVFLIAGVHFGRRAAWVAGLALAALPAHFVQSILGKLDHHVAVAFVSAVLCGVGMAWLARGPDRREPLRSVALGLAMTLALLVWAGSLLHIAVVLAVALGVTFTRHSRDEAAGFLGNLALACAVTFVTVAPFSLGRSWDDWSAFSPSVLSNFHPAFFGSAALALGAVALLWRRTALGVTRARRVGGALLLGGLALALAFAVIPGLGDALLTSSSWFADREDFHSHVLELRPMWMPRGVFTLGAAGRLFSPFIVFLPLALVWLALRTARRREDAGAWLLIAWTTAFFLAASTQIRFSNSLSVPLCLVAGFFVDRLLRAPLLEGPAARGLLAAGLLAAAIPSVGGVYQSYAMDWSRARRGEAPLLVGPESFSVSLLPLGEWMARDTPETSGFLDPDGGVAEYGVLAPWAVGHQLRYYARRPMVQDNFGVYGGRETYDAAEAYYGATDEDGAIAVLERLGVRYVVASPDGSGHGSGYSPETMAWRLSFDGGTAAHNRLEDGSRIESSALSQHRIVYAAKSLKGVGVSTLFPERQSTKVYERVAGARVEGLAAPGARVSARLQVDLLSTGHRVRYVNDVIADAQGRYELRLPYPNGRVSEAVRTDPEWRIGTARASGALVLDDAQVQAGAVVPGPDLRGEPAP
jgi:dolichyl-diphosphooligosaccharide--protein glycosyltransferase